MISAIHRVSLQTSQWFHFVEMPYEVLVDQAEAGEFGRRRFQDLNQTDSLHLD